MFRARATPRHAAVPVGDDVRVVAADRWTSEIGQTLRDAGLTPDDANLISANPIDARVAVARRAHEAWLAEENDKVGRAHPGCRVAAQFVLTDDVWNGRHSRLLLETLELTPYDRWNVRLVAADRASSRATGLPRVYTDQIAEVLSAVDGHIDQLRAQAGVVSGVPNNAADALHRLRRDIAGLCGAVWESFILPGLRD